MVKTNLVSALVMYQRFLFCHYSIYMCIRLFVSVRPCDVPLSYAKIRLYSQNKAKQTLFFLKARDFRHFKSFFFKSICQIQNKAVPLHSHSGKESQSNRNSMLNAQRIVLWCNGSTRVFGSLSLGSNPGSTTRERDTSHTDKKCLLSQTLDLQLSRLEQQTHNLEVPGSSPGWSTFKIKELRNSQLLFSCPCVNNA